MTTSDTSRSSAAGITGPAGPAGDGSPATEPEKLLDDGWNGSMGLTECLSFTSWEIGGRIRHLFGHHSFVDLENWSVNADGTPSIEVKELICWWCPERVPCPPTT